MMATTTINDDALAPTVMRWGILATGSIATAFGKDLSIDPETRQVTKFRHELVAAASSTSKHKAEDFLHRCGAKSDARAYASYCELVNDPGVDIVYIASPHSHHYQNAMLCLLAGKHVLCEKPVTVNALQAKQLFATAKEKHLLLLDGMWIRYFPLSKYVRDIITSGILGPIQRVLAEHSLPYADGFADLSHIMVNPDLAGGILLDSGIYSLTWAFQCLYTTQHPAERHRPIVKSISAQYSATGVDAMTSMLLEFPRKLEAGGHAHAVATTSIGLGIDAVSTEKNIEIPTIRIQGPKGEIQVFPPAYRPTRTRLVLKDGHVKDIMWPQPGPGEGSGWYNGFNNKLNPEGEGHGLFWEADDAARAIQGNRIEGSYLGHDESVMIMEIMDEVRQVAGLRYPESLESTQYPLEL